MAKKEKPDCYKCIHRREVPGDAHSRCNHPALADIRNDSLGEVLAILGGAGRTIPMRRLKAGETPNPLNIEGNRHGIARGWFNHPWNYDPVWLERCDGFTNRGGGR